METTICAGLEAKSNAFEHICMHRQIFWLQYTTVLDRSSFS